MFAVPLFYTHFHFHSAGLQHSVVKREFFIQKEIIIFTTHHQTHTMNNIVSFGGTQNTPNSFLSPTLFALIYRNKKGWELWDK